MTFFFPAEPSICLPLGLPCWLPQLLEPSLGCTAAVRMLMRPFQTSFYVALTAYCMGLMSTSYTDIGIYGKLIPLQVMKFWLLGSCSASGSALLDGGQAKWVLQENKRFRVFMYLFSLHNNAYYCTLLTQEVHHLHTTLKKHMRIVGQYAILFSWQGKVGSYEFELK